MELLDLHSVLLAHAINEKFISLYECDGVHSFMCTNQKDEADRGSYCTDDANIQIHPSILNQAINNTLPAGLVVPKRKEEKSHLHIS